jgi:chromosome segregation ATPase
MASMFSIGDLITLVAVLLILVIFRALDRNNRSLEKLKRFSDKITENLSALIEQKTGQVKELSLELQANLITGKEMIARARHVEEQLQGRESEVQAIRARLADYDRAIGEFATMSARVDSSMQKLREDAEFVGAVDRRIADCAARLEKLEKLAPDIERGIAERARETVAAARSETLAAVQEGTAGLGAQLDGAEKRVRDFAAFLARLEARETQMEQERMEGLEKKLDAFEIDLRGKLAGAAARGESLEDEVFARLAARIQTNEAGLAQSIETLEARLADYQGDVEYRVKSMEEAGQDVDALRGSLSDSLQKTAEAARREMKDAAASLTAGWIAEIAGAAAAREQLQANIAEMQGAIAALKAKAYQDVEKKLSAFEDEFFADLRARSTGVQERYAAWQAETEKRTADFEADLKERIGAADQTIQGLREALRADVEKAKKDAAISFERDLAAVKDGLEAGTRRMHREIEAGLKDLASGLDQGRKELAELFDGAHAEIVVWECRAKQQLADAELAIADRIAGLSADASSSISAMRDAFTAQRDDLVVSTNEERVTLRKELSEMSEAVSAHQADLKRAADGAMEALRGQADAYQLEHQKRMRDVQSEVDTRIKEHRQLMNDAREKADAMQEKLYGRIEEGHRALSASLAEIDKRVKNFMSQTRLFERADTLKASLESTIDEMKKEMTKLNGERAEIAEIEAQLSRTRKVADEVSAKLARFLAEKRRIEDMDGEFKRIISLSKDVDLKMDTLSTSNDALQQIQAKIRQFEEMGKAVDGGFERLEKKKEILSITSEGVDRNFQRLEGIERSLKDADRAAEELAGKVQSLRGDYDMLAGNKKDADSAVETVGKLESIIAELEQRLEKAQSSREWLARTETRFEEIGRAAQEQVRLLESIIKAETRKDKGDRGAPPLDKRETVTKLSHQGWSVQEISRVTQLSRGEVELILELAPKV